MHFYCERCKKEYPVATHAYACECGGLFRLYQSAMDAGDRHEAAGDRAGQGTVERFRGRPGRSRRHPRGEEEPSGASERTIRRTRARPARAPGLA